MSRVILAALALLAHVLAVCGECDGTVRADTEAGAVCGLRRWAANGAQYASFRGVPYAQQPLKELRFKELQRLKSWKGLYDASEHGPICPQTDLFYGRLLESRLMGEDCIRANIHVPIDVLPSPTSRQIRQALQAPYTAGVEEVDRNEQEHNETGAPILVFIHGGGFAFGSGDADVHGPEYLVSKGIIVITFNYRLNVFGFLSLNSSSVPGNNGLRDMVFFLNWVKRNARRFGGNPNDITIGGHSAGACAAHLLTLSPAAEGLFKRAIVMSGTAIPSFYSTSPVYAQFVANLFLGNLGINSTDPDEIHQQLIQTPLQNILKANSYVQDLIGLISFVPVVESALPGVRPILEEDPEILLARGRGKDIPLLIGYTNKECESFRPRFENIDIIARINANPLTIISPAITFTTTRDAAFEIVKLVDQRYYNGTYTIAKFIEACSDTFYVYPALKVAEYRQNSKGAPTYLYKFSYNAEFSVTKAALDVEYTGAGHMEDQTFVFHVNSVPVPLSETDSCMAGLMTNYVVNFVRNSDPTYKEDGFNTWEPVADRIKYQHIRAPRPDGVSCNDLSPNQSSVLEFFNGIWQDQLPRLSIST